MARFCSHEHGEASGDVGRDLDAAALGRFGKSPLAARHGETGRFSSWFAAAGEKLVPVGPELAGW